MELSPEEKKRIYDEEHRRITEEKYRSAIRDALSGEKIPASTPAVTHRRIGITPFIVVLLLLVLGVAIFGIVESQTRLSGAEGGTGFAAPAIFWRPVAKDINETLAIPARAYRAYNLEVTGETMRNYHVTGHFNAGGGMGNDVSVVLCTNDEFANWINGHPAQALYTSGGERTTGSFDVRLPTGSYTLAFSNRSSPIFARQVSVAVKMTYEQRP